MSSDWDNWKEGLSDKMVKSLKTGEKVLGKSPRVLRIYIERKHDIDLSEVEDEEIEGVKDKIDSGDLFGGLL